MRPPMYLVGAVLVASACTMRNPAFGLEHGESSGSAGEAGPDEVGDGDGDGDSADADGSGSGSVGTSETTDPTSETTDPGTSSDTGGVCSATTAEWLPVYLDDVDVAPCGTVEITGPIEINGPDLWKIYDCGACDPCGQNAHIVHYDFDPTWLPPAVDCARLVLDFSDPVDMASCRFTGMTVHPWTNQNFPERPTWALARGSWDPPSGAVGLSSELAGPLDECECTECCGQPVPGTYALKLHGLGPDPLVVTEGDTDVPATWEAEPMLVSVIASHIDVVCWDWPHFDWVLERAG